MIPMTSWTPEFCTVCDKQCILGSVYCSDVCREMDFRKSVGSSEAMSEMVPTSANVSSQEIDSTDSSDEDDLPNLWLAKQAPQKAGGVDPHLNGTISAAALPNKPLLRTKKKDSQFLYASPVLKPSKAPALSPNMSPLLIPQAESDPTEQVSAQSMNTYKRWLADGAA